MLTPLLFNVVAEALVGEGDLVTVAALVGTELARDGVPLAEALEALHVTFATVRGHTPTFAATEAMCVAWSEETLSYLHRISCEDPLTGLASLAHLRGRLGEVYRETTRAGTHIAGSHALVAVEGPTASLTVRDPFHRALRLVRLGETLRTVFSGGETIATAGTDRVVALVRDRGDLDEAVRVVLTLLPTGDGVRRPAQAWVHALPDTLVEAETILDGLARGAGVGAAG